ncbi:MAG TPA: ATP-dependent DNA helicase RecQ [Thermoanaerobaculia bacterium]|jgi:ATP-dependent DNA helicase RecQ|nr:ATP-dependent DNA helicase RecQ [Thermoanaerobaculia bacterium]
MSVTVENTVDTADLEAARAALQETFGYGEFRPGQEEVIRHLLAGRSAAAVFPTGGGKSLCYQIPALLLPGLTLVVSPLIALMKDQIDQLTRRGVAAGRLDSTLTGDEVRALMEAVRKGGLRLLYVAPERFANERFREAISRVRVSLFAVDEAHCVSEWGHNFRPDYLKLAGFGRLCGAERILALTATATPQVLADVCRGFGIAPENAVRTGFHRENLTLRTTPVHAAGRDALLLARLSSGVMPGPAIVYVTQQKTAETVAEALMCAGVPARAYHAGMEDDERTRVQDWFLESADAVVVATIAFGMGIDKADIRKVIHYNLPKSLENLAQEIGRAGRDGQPALCETFVCTDDLLALQSFAYGDTPDLGAVRSLLAELANGPSEMELSLYDLAARHDVRLLVVRTLLTYLELAGYLEAGTPIYAEYELRPLVSFEEILNRFQGERRDFLRGIFQQARKAKVWSHLDLEMASQALGAPRDRLVRALDYLAGQNLLEVRAAGLRHPYRWLRRPAGPEEMAQLAQSLHQRTLDRESREIARLDQVLTLAAHDGCQTAFLAAHFGEQLPHPCGHCSWCENGGQPAKLLSPTPVHLDEARLSRAVSLWRQTPDLIQALADPRAFTRFLTGLPSPRQTRGKLKSHPLFGTFANVPFAEVLRRVEMEDGG